MSSRNVSRDTKRHIWYVLQRKPKTGSWGILGRYERYALKDATFHLSTTGRSGHAEGEECDPCELYPVSPILFVRGDDGLAHFRIGGKNLFEGSSEHPYMLFEADGSAWIAAKAPLRSDEAKERSAS